MNREQYEALVREIQAHDRRYYVENSPTIADVEYDKLYKQLEAIEAEHPDWVLDWSPTRRVASDLTSSLTAGTRSTS